MPVQTDTGGGRGQFFQRKDAEYRQKSRIKRSFIAKYMTHHLENYQNY